MLRNISVVLPLRQSSSTPKNEKSKREKAPLNRKAEGKRRLKADCFQSSGENFWLLKKKKEKRKAIAKYRQFSPMQRSSMKCGKSNENTQCEGRRWRRSCIAYSFFVAAMTTTNQFQSQFKISVFVVGVSNGTMDVKLQESMNPFDQTEIFGVAAQLHLSQIL